MTKEDLEILESVDILKKYNSAKYSKYVVGISSNVIKTLNSVATNNNIHLQSWSCNSCIIRNIITLGELYLAEKENQHIEPEELIETETEMVQTKETTTKRKYTKKTK